MKVRFTSQRVLVLVLAAFLLACGVIFLFLHRGGTEGLYAEVTIQGEKVLESRKCGAFRRSSGSPFPWKGMGDGFGLWMWTVRTISVRRRDGYPWHISRRCVCRTGRW